MARLRQLHQEVALLERETGKAFGLIAHYKRDFAIERGFPYRMLSFLARASNPEASFLQAVNRRSKVGRLGAAHMVNGAHRAFIGSRGHARRAFARNNEAARANHVNRTRDGAKVARIGNVIEQHHERSAVVLFGIALGDLQNIGDAGVLVRLRMSHNALMAAALAALVEHLARHGFHGHVVLLRLAQNVFDLAILLNVVSHKHGNERHLRAQCLNDRAFSFNIVCHVGSFSCALSTQSFSLRRCRPVHDHAGLPFASLTMRPPGRISY